SVTAGTVQARVTMTQTLKKVSAERAVIETMSAIEAGGQTIKSGPFPMEIPARLPTLNIDPKLQAKSVEDPKVKSTRGQETLTIKGKKLKCEWTKSETPDGAVTKMWVCTEVPGHLVKTIVQDKATDSTTTTELVEWKATKK